MSRTDPHKALSRALVARFPGLTVLDGQTESWASVTYTGTRHELRCAPGPDLAGLSEAEFALPGHVLIDIFAEETDGALIVEALTIESD